MTHPHVNSRPSRRPRRDRVRLFLELLEDRTVPSNAIVTENQLPGTPESVWGVFQIGDPTLQGFATDISVNHGQTINFKITDTTNAPYRIDIYRMGYYGGNGARLVTTIPSSQVVRQVQPSPLTNAATGLVDAGNWAVSASWAVPAGATSGLYFARPTREDNGGASIIYFVVRADESTSDLLFQTSDTTWQAYNTWGGNSLYEGNPDGRAYKVSYNRPLIIDNRGGGLGDYNSPLHSEYPMIRWLERNGYDISYFTDVDSDRNGSLIRNHNVFLSVGHDEYWSGQQRANVEAARDAGVNLAFFSGNECYWKVRWENSIAASGAAYRTLVCYKESKNNARIDPLDVAPNWTWTGTWRDTRFSPPSDGGRPENNLTGTMYMNDRTNVDLGISMNVPEADGKMRFWRNTAVANLTAGQTATIGQFVVGYETNEDLDNGFRPGGLVTMSSTTFTTQSHVVVPWGTETGPGTSTHKITLYKAPSGALVFSAGTVQWSWGLDGTHKNGPTTPDPSMQQATVNLFADMQVQPETLQAGLVAATASTDTTAPTSTITSPAPGTVLQVGTPIVVTGTAAEGGGGRLAGVEISVDGGITWRPVTGRASWSYTWTPNVSGPTFIRSRAVDDSANIETPSAGVSVTVSTTNTLVAAYSFDEGAGTTVVDATGRGNDGTVSSTTWTTGRFGNALAFNGNNSWVTVNDANSLDLTSAMTLEAWVRPTALSGWMSIIMKEHPAGMSYSLYANDNAPRPASYVHIGLADYEAFGSTPLALNTWSHLAATYDGAALRLYVNAVQVGSLPLTGSMGTSNNPLRIGGNAPFGEYFNGLIDEIRIYNRVLLPSEISSDMNTPVNIDTTPPTVTSVSPTAGATGVGTGVNATATFSEGMDATTISAATFELRDALNVLVPATVTYDSVAHIATLDPNAALALSATYSARVKGGAAGVKDPSGNPLSADFTWSFTTAAAPPPPSLSINNVSVTESNSGTVSASFTVTLSAASSQTVTVQFASANGTAVAGSDYVSNTGTLTFTPGTTTRPIVIVVNGDAAIEPDETFSVTLSNPTNATIGQAVGTGTIVNDDAPPATGLVAAFGFKEDAGATASDVSGNLNNGTLTNAVWTTAGRYGNALSFNGASSYVTVADANSLDLTTGMTLEAWVNPTTLSGWTTAILKERAGGLSYSLYVSDDTGRPPAGYIFRSGSDVSVTGASAVALNTWTHLATTYDGANLRLYVNGALAGTRATTGAITTSTNALRIGGNTIWGEYFNGVLDEIRVYNRALTATEIQTDMNTPVDGVDNAAPAVALTNPADGATVSGTITVTANASDNVGVTGVQFLLDGANLGVEDTAAPYSISWNSSTSSPGSHTLTARARDAAGNVTTSAAVNITVIDVTAPIVSLTAPTNGATVTGTSTVSANATDNAAVVGVQFLLDGVSLGAEDVTAPYAVSWDTTTASAGAHVLTARARDAAGNTATSAAVNVTVPDTTAPTVALTAPTSGATVTGTVAVSANASDNVGIVGVQFLLDGVNLGAEDSTSPYSISWDSPAAANGTHTLSARARDAAGNTTTSSVVTVTVSNVPDSTAPSISITAPAEGATVTGTISITASASDNIGVAGVQFLLDGANLGAEDTSAPYSIAWDSVATTNGAHSVSARARDAAGNTTTADVVNVNVFNNDVAPPTVSISAPANGATVTGTVTVSANASDNIGVVGVQFLLDGASLGAEDTVAPFSVLWDTATAAPGTHTLTARARDAAGNQTISAAVNVTVADTAAPTVALTAPTNGATVSGNVTVSANAGDNVGVSGVQFLLDGVNLGAEDVASPYSVSWNSTTASNGVHLLTARARDAAGNTTTSSTVSVTVSNAATGLVLALGLSESSGATTQDASGLGNNGTLTNATWTTAGRYGNALSFNGTSSYVTVADANSIDLTTAMTLEAWVKPTSLSGWTTALLKERAGGLSYSLYVSDNTGRPPAGYIFRSGSDVSVAGASAVALNAWTHLATTYDGANLRLYVNGVQAGTSAVTGAITTSTNALRIGGNTVWGEYFSGVLDEVRVYNRALSAAEIQTDMNTPIDGADTTAPTVSVTGPAPGATVSGTIAVTASASDNVGVVGVQFLLDGANLGAEDTIAPYSVSWNTTASSEGAHTLTARARDAAGNLATSTIVNVTVSNADTTAPTVSITSPSDGATIAGNATATANASDNVGVVGVQFLLDGVNLGAEDTSAPYSVAWDSTTIANGTHTITARARDAAGNTAISLGVAVTVANSAAAQFGQWSSVANWPLVAIHTVLLKDGRVLMWDGGPGCLGSTSARVWNPTTDTFTPVPLPYFSQADDDIWCSGQALMADGRVLVVGGHDCDGPQLGIKMVNIFDPVTMSWTRGPDMTYRRWYPTATTLSDGRVLVTAGSVNNTLDYVPVPEIYDPVTNSWSVLTAANQTIPNYAFAFQAPDGRVLVAGSDEAKMATYALNVATQTWTTIDSTLLDAGSAVMFRPGLVMKAGSSYLSAPSDNGGSVPSAATTYVLDVSQPAPAWQQTSSMANARTHLNLTVLPDGNVLATGGSSDIGGVNPANAVYAAEMWSATTQSWRTMSSMQIPRLYHSTAALLPDGRVLVAGGGRNFFNSLAYLNAEIYSPSYLFKGARPTVTSAPATANYGSSFFVGTPDGAGIASVALIRNSAVTHSFNMDQRFVPLSFTQTTGGLTVQAPADANLAPPGHYMLFIVNSDGVPSIAPIVRLPAPYEDAQPPTAPTGLTATGGVGSVNLSWSPSTDNIGVTKYNVHRSTSAGFTPTPANRIAQPVATSYSDSGLAAGTYYYVVTAQDAAGNISSASAQASATATSVDTTAPTVSITSPTGGATVAGTITVAANASDNVGVAGVQFLLDGVNLGVEDVASPYSISWNTTTATNGAHVLTARARDAAGNTTTSTNVSVTVSNTAPTGLVLALGFNESSGTTAADSSGLGNNGTVSGAVWTTAGRYGNALSFDGVNDLLTVADAASLDLTTGMTLEAWVRPTTINGWETAIMKESPNDLAYALYADNNGNDSGGPRRPAAWIRQGSTSYGTAGTSQVVVNTWTHLAATYDGAALRLFVDGVQASSLARTGSLLITANPLRVGGNNLWSEWFGGLIDEVRVYNRALTQSEIQADMNTPIGGGGGGLGLDAAMAVPEPGTAPLTDQMMTPIVAEALARWVAAGAAAAKALANIPVRIADLPGVELGFAASDAIWIDRDAAGHGWFVDPTPADDFEFPAAPNSVAYGKADLLTVLAHELGHALGFEHVQPGSDDLMAEKMQLGVRRPPQKEPQETSTFEHSLTAAPTRLSSLSQYDLATLAIALGGNSHPLAMDFVAGSFNDLPISKVDQSIRIAQAESEPWQHDKKSTGILDSRTNLDQLTRTALFSGYYHAIVQLDDDVSAMIERNRENHGRV